MKKYKRSIKIPAAVATIVVLCVAVVALIPSFGQRLFSAIMPAGVMEPSASPLPAATSTPDAQTTGSPTAQSVPSLTSSPEGTATSNPTFTPSLTLSPPTDASTPTPLQLAVGSTFDNVGTEDWTADSGSLANPGTDGSGGGEGNGFLVLSGGSGGRANYFIAPSRYHGNWQDYAELNLDLWSRGGNYFVSGYGIHGDIYIASGSATAQRFLPYRPPEQWETFVVPLVDDGGWVFGGGATALADVLGNVTEFQIRAEYGTGSDTAGLDNVELVP